MSELETQAAFRDEVRKDLAEERTILDNLGDRVAELEQIVIRGNGHQALTVQVKELEVKVDNMGKELGIIRDQMDKLGKLNDNVVAIKTQLELKGKSDTNWWQVAVILIGVVATAVAQYLLK